ncbi:MAG: tungsten formylmethanofuran dehydrogenase [Candidatus Wallbacteria bacterium HGW-Wallbacteria-1]|uniref:Tungsten formylmethanofuran dehydrogenase n=1 Tax=Candidatus Wallbacteria bacterium HGW-Wallbacteria-1 TaxID=2013854 RepID=A0A2N1PSG3_9BACT|nr:MAG: tungsten formylmethanofuran dehydrogenase [Candidatus Wallbacteria bacterium HGW-Wallbacteria-1]
MPRIVVDDERCKGCGLCIDACPKKIIVESEKLNSKGYHPAKQVNEEKCVGCKICATVCPDCAIEVFK